MEAIKVWLCTAMIPLGAMLGGCEAMRGVTWAPKSWVEACLQEAYPASGHGWGPQCNSLNEWAKLHDWAFGGPATGAQPNLVPKPVPPEGH